MRSGHSLGELELRAVAFSSMFSLRLTFYKNKIGIAQQCKVRFYKMGSFKFTFGQGQ